MGYIYSMREVSKQEFKETYLKYGKGSVDRDLSSWNESYEKEDRPMKYLIKEPETSEHTRMQIVTDYSQNEYRLFFLTEDDEERMYWHPE